MKAKIHQKCFRQHESQDTVTGNAYLSCQPLHIKLLSYLPEIHYSTDYSIKFLPFTFNIT